MRQPSEINSDLPFYPALSFGFGEVSSSHQLYLFKVWNFFYIYAVPLQIYPFTLDQFLEALSCKTGESDLIAEAFGSFLSIVCKEWAARTDPISGINANYCFMPEKNDDGTWHTNPKVSETIGRVIADYDTFSLDERGGVDQWYKWQPGRWAASPKKRPISYGFTKDSVNQNRPSDRLKAWTVALFGFVKDWFVDECEGEVKWNILQSLLSPKQYIEPFSPEKDEILLEFEDSNFDGSSNSDILNSDILMDVDEVDQLTHENTKNKKKVVKSYLEIESELSELDWDEEDALPTSRRGRVAIPVKVKPVIVKIKKTPKPKKIQIMGFEELCDRLTSGFTNLSADQIVELLHFMLEACVIDSERFRPFREQSTDTLNELKREQRDSLRDCKIVY